MITQFTYKDISMKELFRTKFTSNGEYRPINESTKCLELAYNYVMKGYKLSIEELSIICKITLYSRYNSIIDFINGNIKDPKK